jgi:hypothetical protein
MNVPMSRTRILMKLQGKPEEEKIWSVPSGDPWEGGLALAFHVM